MAFEDPALQADTEKFALDGVGGEGSLTVGDGNLR